VEGREGVPQDGNDVGAHCYGEPGGSEVLDEAASGARGGCEESFWDGIGDAMGQGEVSLKVSLVVWASRLWQGVDILGGLC
jgi:hypothetical protein